MATAPHATSTGYPRAISTRRRPRRWRSLSLRTTGRATAYVSCRARARCCRTSTWAMTPPLRSTSHAPSLAATRPSIRAARTRAAVAMGCARLTASHAARYITRCRAALRRRARARASLRGAASAARYVPRCAAYATAVSTAAARLKGTVCVMPATWHRLPSGCDDTAAFAPHHNGHRRPTPQIYIYDRCLPEDAHLHAARAAACVVTLQVMQADAAAVPRPVHRGGRHLPRRRCLLLAPAAGRTPSHIRPCGRRLVPAAARARVRAQHVRRPRVEAGQTLADTVAAAMGQGPLHRTWLLSTDQCAAFGSA